MSQASEKSTRGRKPARYKKFAQQYPALAKAYEILGSAASEAGPLDARTRELVKLALSIGAWREGAVHSHTRRALEEGCTAEEIRHAVVLAITTLGFPSTMAAMSWVEDVIAPQSSKGSATPMR
ncbi:MAG: carboxymuconolactone decarboxylase family protein [Verrucomicrobiales bacterium]